MKETLNYYNNNAESFVAGTINSDMSNLYSKFERYLFKEASILDCGCGSGRDTKYFLNRGYTVTAIDGSEELCRKASEITGIDVKTMLFQDIHFKEKFDGVWACASLLHLKEEELVPVICSITDIMNDGGVFYASFKYGDFSGERNGRFFTDRTEESIKNIVEDIPELEILEMFITADVRPGREEEKWLNVIMKKRRYLK